MALITQMNKDALAERLKSKHAQILEWCMSEVARTPLPLYYSVDMRDSGFKIAPVDGNLYPAGFNNICHEDMAIAPNVFSKFLKSWAEKNQRPLPKNILILPEYHTSNKFYLENVYWLYHLISEAGFDVRVGWNPEAPFAEPFQNFETAMNRTVQINSTYLEDGMLKLKNFEPDLIVLNNDFSSGFPEKLKNLKQPILPSENVGWHTRKKSENFCFYHKLLKQFCHFLEIDPWLFSIETREVAQVDFNEGEGLDQVEEVSAQMLQNIQNEYRARKISSEPVLFIKSNQGTYGMGIMTIKDPSEIKQINRRTKNKMSVGKGKANIHSVIIQEGIPTATLIDGLPAEPVIYMIGCEWIGGFLRSNSQRSSIDNLNAQGMVFKKLCMSDLKNLDQNYHERTLELIYGWVARLSALAAAREIRLHHPIR